ncbi:MAG: site-specific integrase [Thermodesulfovibrionales bacterium]|jgi:integrase
MGIYRRKDREGNWLPNWYLSFQDANGRQVQICSETDNKEDAEALLRHLKNQVWMGRYFPGNMKKTYPYFRELWDAYSKAGYATERDHYSIKHLLPVFGNLRVTVITDKMVSDYVSERLEEDEAAHSTVEKEFGLGRKMYNHVLGKKEWRIEFGIDSNPWTEAGFPGYDNQRCRVLTVDEEKLLIEAASPTYLSDVVVFALHTACRRKEILWLQWCNVDFERRIIRVKISKRKRKQKPRYKTIPMSRRCFEMLSKRREALSDLADLNVPVFPIAVEALKDAFERAVEKAELQNFVFHDLRHTCISRWAMMGVPEAKIVSMAGWTTSEMFQRYAHFAPHSLHEAAAASDKFYEMSYDTDMTQEII